ncbi:MAG: alpha-L-fucosidase, partial [Tepidisphaeraceae bacterium]
MRRAFLAIAIAVVGAFGLGAQADDAALAASVKKIDQTVAAGPFKAEWASLKAHKDPEWFRDAKFGIYTHWGPVTVGTGGAPHEMEWYGRQLYDPKHAAFFWHQQQFGDQKTVGYKDVIPAFKAEKFDAEAWAELFARSGAKFAGPVAVHHDNFANWDSSITRWNARAMGPKRDLTGEFEQAIRKRGLKFITTFHHGFAWRYFEPAHQYDGADPQYADLYGEAHDAKAPPTKLFLDRWLGMVDEVLQKYQPDLIWFDFELGSVITPEYQQRMFADTYDWAAKNGREIGVTHKHREIHQYTGILDFERGREDRLTEYVWLTDTSIGPWFHHNCLGYKSVDQLVDVLVDIVSKNGCMLLNVGPLADGRIPDTAQGILTGIGDWLKVNGEAIYGTRPWTIFGEGPTRNKGGGFSENADRPFTARDIRFTTRGDKLYAIALAWPLDRQLTVKSLAKPNQITKVELLGHDGELKWAQTEENLVVTMPESKPCQNAYALRITGQKLAPVKVETSLEPGADGSVLLEPDTAQFHGKVRAGNQNDHDYIGWWDDAADWVSWSIRFATKGTYQVRAVCSANYGDTSFVLEIAGHKTSATAKQTKTWFDYQTLNLGEVEIPRGGVFELSIR